MVTSIFISYFLDLTREKSNTQLQESDTEDKSKKEFPATQKTMTMTGAMKKFGTSRKY